ncbi:hypothetical protein BIW11_11512 [Tropilaelaps mercedesae]|uniref:Uncharacterized protein n=1 Tax=Tropilaelaps mercedesae TaxID=418985 RepID=A0A1V9XBB4_9ACAR|nr:hypothetical protein BIW11_11512 [Tropilaelaps mercedesae]
MAPITSIISGPQMMSTNATVTKALPTNIPASVTTGHAVVSAATPSGESSTRGLSTLSASPGIPHSFTTSTESINKLVMSVSTGVRRPNTPPTPPPPKVTHSPSTPKQTSPNDERSLSQFLMTSGVTVAVLVILILIGAACATAVRRNRGGSFHILTNSETNLVMDVMASPSLGGMIDPINLEPINRDTEIMPSHAKLLPPTAL